MAVSGGVSCPGREVSHLFYILTGPCMQICANSCYPCLGRRLPADRAQEAEQRESNQLQRDGASRRSDSDVRDTTSIDPYTPSSRITSFANLASTLVRPRSILVPLSNRGGMPRRSTMCDTRKGDVTPIVCVTLNDSPEPPLPACVTP